MAKKVPATPHATPRAASVDALLAQPIAQIQRLCAEAARGLHAVRAALPESVALATDERAASAGKIGSDELPEHEALLDVADARPHVFVAMAGRDHGADPGAVETGPTRQAIEVMRALDPVLVAARALLNAVSDTRLRVGERVREVTTTVRTIAKANAPVDPAVRAGLAKVEALRNERLKKSARPKKKPAKPPA